MSDTSKDNSLLLRHTQYFVHCLQKLPSKYVPLDTNRLTLVHFAIQSLEMLGFFDSPENLIRYSVDKHEIIEWIYTLQTLSHAKEPGIAGFKGGTFLGNVQKDEFLYYNQGHLAMTYSALCTLITLGDDLERVDKKGIVKGLQCLQKHDGSFSSLHLGSENDLRFVYCACAISHILNDWSGVDIDRAVQYIQACRTWDGAISLIPGQESHGGSTFCGVASLNLMGRLKQVLDDHDNWRNELVQWCVSRQIEGMQGRSNKLEDTCYSFWIGGTLKILNCDHLLDQKLLRAFVTDCQSDMGGFSKLRDPGRSYYPDLLHSFYSLSWLSFSHTTIHEEDVINNGVHLGSNANGSLTLHPLNCTLGMSSRRIDMYRKGILNSSQIT